MRSSSASPGPSKPTMCMPGWLPARRATTSSTSGSGAPGPSARRARRLEGRCGRSRSASASAVPEGRSGLRAAVLLEDVGVVVGKAAEAARGLLGQLAEEDGGEAERGRHDGACVGLRQACGEVLPGRLVRGDQPVVPMTKARQPAASARSHVRQQGGLVAELEGHVDRREVARLWPPGPPDDGHDLVAAGLQRGGDGAAHVAGPGDECSHRVWSLWLWDRAAGSEQQKTAGTSVGVCGPRSRPSGPESVIPNEAV